MNEKQINNESTYPEKEAGHGHTDHTQWQSAD